MVHRAASAIRPSVRPCPAFAVPGSGGARRGSGRPPRMAARRGRSTAAPLLHPAEWNDHAVAHRGAHPPVAPPPVRVGPDARRHPPQPRIEAAPVALARLGAGRAARRTGCPAPRSRLQHGPMSEPPRRSRRRTGRIARAGAGRAVRSRPAGHHRRPAPAHPGHRLRGDGRRHRDARGDRRPRRGVRLRRGRSRRSSPRPCWRRCWAGAGGTARARGPPLLVTPLLFGLGLVVAGTAGTLAQLLVGRVLQGASAGAVRRRRSC